MQINYQQLGWNDGQVFEHRRLAKEYIETGVRYASCVKYKKNIPNDVIKPHEEASRNLSQFLDRIGARKLTKRL